MANSGGNKPSEDDEIEWIVTMKDGVTDKQVDDLCHDKAVDACLSEGHPDEHGLALTGVKATVKGLRKMLKHHPGEVKHIEPNLPIYLPPNELDFRDIGKDSSLLQTMSDQPLPKAFFTMQWVDA